MTRLGTVPPGWEENPTAWAERIRLVVLALLEPLPDADLGALAYLAEIVLSPIGGKTDGAWRRGRCWAWGASSSAA